jgi:hypothetical protein
MNRTNIITVTSLAVSFLAGCDAGDTENGEAVPDEALVAGDSVLFDGVELVVPEIGQGVGITAEGDDGYRTLTIENTVDGVRVTRLGDRADEPYADADAPESNALGACADTYYVRTGHKWRTAFGWYYHAASVPTGIRASVLTLLQKAANNIVTGRNDCGRADAISASHIYRGATSTAPAINTTTSSIVCGSRNNVSSIGFKALSGTWKAATCWWWDSSGYNIESDMVFNSFTSWILTSGIPEGCTTALHFESVSTHEMGHVFGLNHPGTSHPALTMQPGAACDNSKATLGLGDLRGLEYLY